MKDITNTLLSHIGTCLRLVIGTMGICCLVYPLIILLIGQVATPFTANGWLLKNNHNRIIGSQIIAQKFVSPKYFQPRPSAVDYDAAMSGGSNLSPANPLLTQRAEAIIKRSNASVQKPVPPDLLTTSGSGLDPDISLGAADFQAKKVATARNLPVSAVADLVRRHAFLPGGFLTQTPIVNVLVLNRSLDQINRDRK